MKIIHKIIQKLKNGTEKEKKQKLHFLLKTYVKNGKFEKKTLVKEFLGKN